VIAFDLDYFKRINDNHGHAAGDEVLQRVCRLVMQATKRRDYLGRLGGEEFALLLPDTTLAGGITLAQSLCDQISQLPFGKIGTVSASFGLAAYEAGDSIASLLHRADESLYRAKAAGRNRVDIVSD
jgi:diguanylate cyclase (GGDEF)-like protein